MLRLKRKIYRGYRCHCREAGGFTIVEIIVALAILSTSMLAVFGVLRMCTAANSNSQRLTESVMLAEKLMTEITLGDKVTYQTTKGSKGIFSWQIQTAPTGMDNLAAISIEIQWLDQQKPQQYQLYSLIHIPVLVKGK